MPTIVRINALRSSCPLFFDPAPPGPPRKVPPQQPTPDTASRSSFLLRFHAGSEQIGADARSDVNWDRNSK